MAKASKETLERLIAQQVITNEYEKAKSNAKNAIREYESCIDMLECRRTEKNAKWKSDIFIPEYTSHVLTDSGIFASMYFQTKDFVECYLEDEGEVSKKKAAAAKELINRTLNQRHLRIYSKLIRAWCNDKMAGYVYGRCWWEQEYKPVRITQKVFHRTEPVEEGEIPEIEVIEEIVDSEELTIDRFNMDVLDPRNVFTDNKYCYTIQDKKWVIIRFEKTLEELKADKKRMGYINMDKVAELRPPVETQTSKDSYNKDDKQESIPGVSNPYDILERHGLYWVIVKERDNDGYPIRIEAGLDSEGKPLDKAELIETIISFAVSDNGQVLIRFQPQPYRDFAGRPFKPIIRGLYYIHPSKDHGIGDGKLDRELQIAINDNFNLSQDRVMLATMPTLKGNKFEVENNTQIYFAPGHAIPLNDMNNLEEFKIEDNIEGALKQNAVLESKMQQVDAITPPTMGMLPSAASTTATAVTGADSRSSMRSNYKFLTFEYTYLNEIYWMIQQMTYWFAGEKTAYKLLGEKVYDFDPSAEYVYKPLTQSIQTQYSSAMKRKEIMQMIGYIAQIPNPNTPKLLNLLAKKYFELSGDEYVSFGDALLDESVPITPEGGNGIGQPMLSRSGAPSNQNMIPMGGMEEMTRSMAGA